MSNSVTSATYIRKLRYSLRSQLSDFLDPQERWKEVMMSIRKPDGEYMFSQRHMRKYEGLVLQGKSPTMELLNDWGTINSTVGQLVDILKSHKLLAAASLLLPEERVTAENQQAPVTPTVSGLPTRRLDNTETRGHPIGSDLQPAIVPESSGPEQTQGSTSFLYSDLMRITDRFNDRPMSDGGSRLGEGGFGTVYKGFLNGRAVAVKKLKPMDDISMEELQSQFNQEIQTLTVLKHKNLVDMVGFSCDGPYPCLVYVFMGNGSLLDRLACLEGSPPLTWQQRCLIAEGTAEGLEYLHSNHHVHRDVKSGNILLDEEFVAKVSDFGLTRASATRTSTTMMTERIVGTCAYMAPEALRGQITPRSDVFSFGVVLLEILSGLPPVDENREQQFLMDMRQDIDDEDEELTLEAFVDKKLRHWELSQVESIYSLACHCLHEKKNRRPVMEQVLSELKGIVKSMSLDFPALV